MRVLPITAAGMLDAQTRFENSARRTAQMQPDHLAEEIVEQVQVKIAFRANAAALKTADDMTGALLDILA
jgi:flagellar hook protein FlgE